MPTEPYPWPYDHDPSTPLGPDRMALVVSGWQAFWLPTLAKLAPVERIGAAIDRFRSIGVAVIWVRHGSGIGGVTRRRLPSVGSEPWQLLTVPAADDVVIDTPGLDAFLVEWTDLALRSRSIDRLIMCGLGTEGPVSGTTRSANDRGYECITATDLLAHHDPVTGAAQLSSICMSGGIFGAIGTAAELLDHLQQSEQGVFS